MVHLSATCPRHFDFLRLSLQTKLSFQKWRGINQTSSVFWGAMQYQQRLWLLWAETAEMQTSPSVWNCVVFVLWLPYFTWWAWYPWSSSMLLYIAEWTTFFLRLSDVSLFVHTPLFLSVHHWWMIGCFYILALVIWGIQNSQIQRSKGFPGGSDGKESTCNAGDPGLIHGSGRPSQRRKWQPTPVLLPGISHGQRSLEGYSPWGSHRVGHDWVTNTLYLYNRISMVTEIIATFDH